MHGRFTRFGTVLLFMVVWGWVACTASAGKTATQDLSPTAFKSLLDQHQGDSDVVLLDIRTPAEYQQGHIQGALLVDYYGRDFVDRLKTLDRQKTYLVYCRSGNRSGKSLAIFDQLGFRRVYHLSTGLVGWSQEKYPLVR